MLNRPKEQVMTPTIKTISAKKLIGMHLIMSLVNNKTGELWSNFMPNRKEIANAIGADLYSLQVYKEDYFTLFNPAAEFEKWALTEVHDFDAVPQGMETFNLQGGLYAIFHYKGNPENGAEVFRYIFQEWLPQSGYRLDDRPHFEMLGDKYKNGSDDSEEEIWIPIK
mgnify:CR=1 FL=1